MKEAAVILLALLAFVSPGFARDEFIITKISPTMVPTPNVGGDKRHSGDDHWLAVEVDFKANVDSSEELTFKWFIAAAGKALLGESTYVNVEKGRDLHAVMYVSPRALKRLTFGKRFSATSVENVTVQITSKGQVIAERSVRDVRSEWWKSLEQVKGLVLKKSETPFAWVDWDYYEELKAEAH